MAQSSRTFRVFVSSTFSDLEAERNALQKDVFPRLRELAIAHGCRFQAIDLRWGVSDEASLDQQAMNICLGEIERCQKVSPRPNFIILLGDRYGWCPPPSQVKQAEFEQILGLITPADEKALLQEWYFLDQNAVPSEYRLKPRQRGSEYEKYENWQPVEARLRAILAEAVGRLNLTPEQQLPYIASATEQEIHAGALSVKEAPEHVFCFFREISGLPQGFDPATKNYLNLDERLKIVDEEAHKKQNSLKERLEVRVPGNVYHYPVKWAGEAISQDHIVKLCEDVYNSLARIIDEEVEHPHENVPTEKEMVHIQPAEALDVEGVAHHAFAEERLHIFVGRTEMLAKVAGYLKENGCRSLAIVGVGGTGKSALMARLIQQSQADRPDAEIVYRFIGATPASSDGRSLLDSLCHELSRRYGADTSNIPGDYRELVPELGKRMALASAEKPLVLFLDSLDQLSAGQDARSLIWLPKEMPEHVSVIASTREDDTLKALRSKQAHEETLGGLSRSEGDELLSQWLASVHRTLQEAQRREVLDKCIQSQGNPLYLRLAFEEARLWTSAQPQEQLVPEVKGIIERNMIDRLQNESSHGQALVSHALGYLAASRYGLAEDELLDLLSRDLQVYSWFFQKSFHLPADLIEAATQYLQSHPSEPIKAEEHSPLDKEKAALAWFKELRNSPEQLVDFLGVVLPKANGPRLPMVLWSRLSFDLAPYLAERLVDGSVLLNFYHRELGDVAKEIYLAGGKDRPYHVRLADYFNSKSDPAGDQTWTGNSTRGLGELPYHLAAADQFDEQYRILTDFLFLQHKVSEVGVTEHASAEGKAVKIYGGIYLLQNDFELAVAKLDGTAMGSSRKPIIVTAVDFGNGLVVGCPWCNKRSPLQKRWRGAEITCPECRGPLRVNEFVVGRHTGRKAMIRFTLFAHRSRRANASSLERQIRVLKVVDRALKLSAPFLITQPRSLPSQLTGRLACNPEPDIGRLLDKASEHASRPWLCPLTPALESASGPLERVLIGHTAETYTIAITPNGTRIISGGIDGSVRIWDLASGRLERTLEGHKDSIMAVAVTPDGCRIISGGIDHSVRVWDLASGRLERMLRGHTDSVQAVAVTKEGNRIISAGNDATIRVWNLTSGILERTFEGHNDKVTAFAVTPEDSRIVSGGGDNPLRVWNIISGKLERTLGFKTSSAIALTPDGRRIVTSSNQKVCIWNVANGKLERSFEPSQNSGLSIVVTPDGSRIVSGGIDGTLRIWNLRSGHLECTLDAHIPVVWALAVTPDGSRIISGGGSGFSKDGDSTMQTIQVWNLESCLSENKLVGDKGSFGVHAVTTTPDSRRIVSGGYRTLKVWDFTSGRLERTLEGHTGLVLSVEVTPDGDRIVSRGYNFVRVWNLARGRLEYTLPKYHSSIAVTPDGHQIVSGGEGFAQPKNYNAVRVWDIVSGRQERTIVGSPDRVLSVAVTPDHRRIVSGDDDASVRIWDLASGRLERTLVGHKVFVVSVAVTPDSSRILSRSADGIVRIWDVESGNLERSLPNSDTETYIKPDILGLGWREGLEAVVTRDGRRIVLKGKDANLLIWDLESGRLESKLKSQIDSVYCFAITMDSARIIFRGEDRTLCIWDLASGQEIASWTPDPGLTITSCCTVPKDPSLFVYGDSAGVVHVLKLLEDPG